MNMAIEIVDLPIKNGDFPMASIGIHESRDARSGPSPSKFLEANGWVGAQPMAFLCWVPQIGTLGDVFNIYVYTVCVCIYILYVYIETVIYI